MLRIALPFLLAFPAAAEEAPWPDAFTGLIEAARTQCAGDFSVFPETVVQRDLNGDGAQDWLLDMAGFSCSTSASLYCGTEGCGVETLIDGIPASLTLRRWEVVTEDGTTYLAAPNRKGQTVRFLWTGDDWQLQ
jgi:hypothetical protein